jgi:biotin carboxyl carrier protein
MKYIVTIGESVREIEVNVGDEIVLDGQRMRVDFQDVAGEPVYSLLLDGQSFEAYVQPDENGMQVLLHGQLFSVLVEDERQRRLRESGAGKVVASGEYHLKAPMPGLVIALPVEEGQHVESGANLAILESMKMQNELKAPREGIVGRLRVKPGDSVDQNQILLTLE